MGETDATLAGLVDSFAGGDWPALADYLQDNPGQVAEALRLLAPRERKGPGDDERLARVEFFVEVAGDDYMHLWANHAEEATMRRWNNHDGPRLHWQADSRGTVATVGWLAGLPVNLSFRFARLNGRLVCFWEAVSRAVDYELAKGWLRRHYTPRWDGGGRPAFTDAMNFHHCLEHCGA